MLIAAKALKLKGLLGKKPNSRATVGLVFGTVWKQVATYNFSQETRSLFPSAISIAG
jgi:hypothetical protein